MSALDIGTIFPSLFLCFFWHNWYHVPLIMRLVLSPPRFQGCMGLLWGAVGHTSGQFVSCCSVAWYAG